MLAKLFRTSMFRKAFYNAMCSRPMPLLIRRSMIGGALVLGAMAAACIGGVTDKANTAPELSLPNAIEVHEGLSAVFLQPSANLAAGRSANWFVAGRDAAN